MTTEFSAETDLFTRAIRGSRSAARFAPPPAPTEEVVVRGGNLSVNDVIRVARYHAPVRLTDDPQVLARVQAAWDYISTAAASGKPIYGVTTGFGGMADVVISGEDASELQNNLIWYHKTGAGKYLPLEDVRSAMLLRANALMCGASGIRIEIIRRLVLFLNEGVTPYVHELGSIGASGDLVPLTAIAGCLIGLDDRFRVDFRGEEMGAVAALEKLGVPRLTLGPKEGLALINGTSVMAGTATNVVHDAQELLGLAMGAHALMIQALGGTNQSFHPFIHAVKPHPGQIWAAARMQQLLEGSGLVRDEMDGSHEYREDDLIQDRYSLRCLPQYMGPIVDGMALIAQQVEVELNSVSDNPLIDITADASYHGGNFLGQYIGVGMDHLRYYVGLMAKHLDTQIALLVSPFFSNGLPPSLRGNSDRKVNMGLKGLQLSANSIMPMLGFLGNSIADRFPTHAEQFNQNINSQGFNSANLARQSVDIFRQYIAISLMFGVQAADLRTYRRTGHYDARATLSPGTSGLYEAVRAVVGVPPSVERPYVWNDNEQILDIHIARIAADIAAGGQIAQAINRQ
jgi:phenylalanine ammonia-lyase